MSKQTDYFREELRILETRKDKKIRERAKKREVGGV